MEKGGGVYAVGSLTKAKVPMVKNLIQKYSHDIYLVTVVYSGKSQAISFPTSLYNDHNIILLFLRLHIIAGHVYQYTSLFKTLGSLIR